MPIASIPIGPFKGLNLLDPGPDELSQCINFRLNDLGYPYKRPGYGGYGSSPAKINGDALTNFLHRYYKSGGTKELVAAAGGLLRKGNDSTGGWTNIPVNGAANTISATTLPYRFVYKDRLYIVEGTRPQRYNGTDSVDVGHFIPVSSTWTITPGAGGSLTPSSAYQYKMTIVAGLLGDMGEGPASAAKSGNTGGGQNRNTLTNLDSAPATHEASAKKLYRTKAGGSIFYFLATIAAGATSYTDDIADTALGAEHVVSHSPAADSKYAFLGQGERTYWFGRAGANASVVEASDVGFPDRIVDGISGTVGDFFAVNNNDGDLLTGGCNVPGGDLFFKRNSIWLLRFFGFGLIPLAKGVGTVSPLSIVQVPNGAIFLSQEGRVYFVNTGEITPDNEVGYKVRPAFAGMSGAALGRVVACYHDGLYIIAYDPKGAKGYNNTVLEYDVIRGRWYGPHSNGDKLTPSYFSVWDSERDNRELYWGEAKAANGSYVYGRTTMTQTDNGTKFPSTVRLGKRMTPRQSEKKVYSTRVRGTFSSDAQLTAAVIQDDESRVTTPVTGVSIAQTNPGTWDVSTWDAANWVVDVSSNAKGSFVPKGRARKPVYELSDGATATSVAIDEMELTLEELPSK